MGGAGARSVTRTVVPERVLALARAHLAFFRPPRGARWAEPSGVRVAGGWYFDYAVEWVGRPKPFGFAPGYLVGDGGTVRTVGWGELRQVHGLPPAE
jgi:hypothetical protein